MSLSEYLAKNYLTADAKPDKKSKKRKRHEVNNGGISITDDDLSGWTKKTAGDDEDDETTPTVVGHNLLQSRPKSSKWKTIGTAAPSNADQKAADAIIADAAAESRARAAEDEDAPQIVDEEDDHQADAQLLQSGAKAGLQSAAEVTAALEKRKKDERKRLEASGDPASLGKGQETIYRDASGRVVNVAMQRAEARRKAEEEQKKKDEATEALKGDVQRQELEARRQQLRDAKYMTVARHADDVEMNEELKERERWNDPAAAFLTKKKERKSATGKKLYQGPSQPNRYGIRPGYRWDGVDRGNGFERKWFEARNKKQNIRNLEYAWQMDE